MSEKRLLELTADDFERVRGSRFQLTPAFPEAANGAEPPSFDAELVEVTAHPENTTGSFRTPFAIVFNGPLVPVLPQGTYRVEHDQLGTIELFLVPIGPDTLTHPGREPTAMQYEAVFG